MSDDKKAEEKAEPILLQVPEQDQIIITWNWKEKKIYVDGTAVHDVFLFNALMGMASAVVNKNLLAPKLIAPSEIH